MLHAQPQFLDLLPHAHPALQPASFRPPLQRYFTTAKTIHGKEESPTCRTTYLCNGARRILLRSVLVFGRQRIDSTLLTHRGMMPIGVRIRNKALYTVSRSTCTRPSTLRWQATELLATNKEEQLVGTVDGHATCPSLHPFTTRVQRTRVFSLVRLPCTTRRMHQRTRVGSSRAFKEPTHESTFVW